MPTRRMYLLSMLVVVMFGVSAKAQDASFDAWRERFKASAEVQGISQKTLDAALDDITPNETVVALDGKQPESKITLEKYLSNTISQRRVRIGREMLREHADILAQVTKRYGVQAKYIVALWGIESDYGNHQGNFSVVRSLATLAHDGRREALFTKELIAALTIIDKEGMRVDDLTGSWAGAMGNCQFMPSTYLRYGVDGNGDGKRDIWSNEADTFASIANYLSALGWDGSVNTMEPEVVQVGRFTASDASIDQARMAQEWGKLGMVTAAGTSPAGKQKLYAVYLSKTDEEANRPALVSENFKALLNWNRSRYFATAVGTLADAIEDE